VKLDLPLSVGGADAAEAARRLAEAGVDGAYAFEGPNDVFVPLARAAGAAPIDLYSNIAVSFPRSPVHLAHTAWDLAHLSGGRFLLGLGSQVRAHVERRFGAEFAHPARRMAEQVDAVRAIFRAWQDGTPLDHRGEFWQLDLMPPLFRPNPLPSGPPPVLVAAVGPRMTEVAAAHADGVLLHPFTADRYVHDHTVPVLDAALAAAGRRRDGFVVVGGAIAALSGAGCDQQTADDAARGLVASYGSTPAYRPVLDAVGHGELQPELRTLTPAGRWAEMGGLVDDAVLASIVLRGTAEEVATQLLERYAGVADRVGVTLPHAVDLADVAALADAVAAAVAARGV
jgi:probable F420-dependent oxidoreductase